VGCDLINNGGKKLRIYIHDYDSSKILIDTVIDIEGVKRLQVEVYGDNVVDQ